MSIELYRRRRLRRDSTDAEAALWSLLRGRRFHGFKFRRQHSCGPFFLDFYCADRHLAIELDGGQHYEPAGQLSDAGRDRYIESCGIKVLRIATDLVFRDQREVLMQIAVALGLDPSVVGD